MDHWGLSRHKKNIYTYIYLVRGVNHGSSQYARKLRLFSGRKTVCVISGKSIKRIVTGLSRGGS